MIVELELKDLTIPQGLLPRVLTGTVEERVEEYKEMLEQGVEFDPITVWKRLDEQYWIVDGVHRTEAHKRAGRSTIKAKIVELKDELEYRIEAIRANLKHGLPLQKEEKILLTQTLYKLGVSIPELKKLFGVAERTLYYWLEPVKEKEKEELRKKALELREQGLTQEEVAERLGVSQQTISVWLNENSSQYQKLQKLQNLVKDGTPTPEGFKALSEFIEEHEEELREKSFNEVVKDQALRDILKYLNEAVKRDFKKLIDAPSYDKVINYLSSIYPYKELSLRARKMFFNKAQTLWESLKKEHEERKQFESLVLEKAKEVLSKPDYQFHSWRTLRVDLFRITDLQIFGKEELIDEILREHADELLAVYKQIKEATEDSLTEEELREIILAVAQKAEEIDVRFSLDEVEKRIIEALVQKSLRADYSVVNKLRKKAEELAKQMIKEHSLIMTWWMLNYSQEALKKIDEIDLDIEISDEDIEELKQMYENMKAPQAEKKKEKKEKSLPPDIEDWYRKQLELLLMDMGIKIGWVKAFEIADEIYQKVREYSQKAVRGW
ncbi:transcriptional regulator, XRE family [Hydrogenobacter thermophilus TK-6]|uniref:ParB-like protein n=1 Tax=Hydrogenobacter thermophilus (strain DSM 6534 / IAM 12695 / TK-6) TaxID=608538 RepID=D3DHR1_HYDTT|nr:helix-turn-helix domain-containing protein [Hydrogenobacter thermophilus]ADO45298.1 transcriptional regulator, XRE family [Hydrogenobacter thermophilus TK-6]BAI69363.1 ParB-like protein [Hydrogenobacter thermophilus TK-6]